LRGKSKGVVKIFCAGDAVGKKMSRKGAKLAEEIHKSICVHLRLSAVYCFCQLPEKGDGGAFLGRRRHGAGAVVECKPNSVAGPIKSDRRRPFLWCVRRRTTQAAYPSAAQPWGGGRGPDGPG